MATGLEEARKIIDETDGELTALFECRMGAVREIAEYKKENGIDIYDSGREKQLIEKNLSGLKDKELLPYCEHFLKETVKASRDYQYELTGRIPGISIGSHLIDRASEIFDLDRKVLVVTDSGVPEEYAKAVASQCREAITVTVDRGEESKCLENVKLLWDKMLQHDFTRSDCCVAVGGGVVSDLTGFAASCYMRGIDFYNVPTTLLAQADASIGGKTAVDYNGVKNVIGAFNQPKGVIVDTALLSTLDERQISNGMAEIIKMAVILDKNLFELIEESDFDIIRDEIVERSIRLKWNIVRKDEKEKGIRRILNFGHTYGHAVEKAGGLLHGEAVAIGMCRMCSDEVRERLVPLLEKYSLPTETDIPDEKLRELIRHDKKSDSGIIRAVWSEHIGECEIREIDFQRI